MSSNPQITIGVSAVNTADAELKKLDDKIRETTGIVTTESGKVASSTASASDKVSSATSAMGERVKQNYLSIAQAAAGLGAGIVGFATSFSTLERAQTRADQAQLTYERSLTRLNTMIAEGGHSADELAQQQEKVRINADKAKQAQDSLSDSYTNFLANVPSQMIAFGMSANGIYTMLKAQQTTTAATSTTTSAAYTGALASMRVANTTTAISTQALGNAMKTAFLSNPVTLPLIAITTIIAALAFNVGGLRDRVNEFGKAVGDALPFLRPLLNALGALNDVFDGGSKKSKDLADSTSELGDVSAATAKKIQSYTDYVKEQADKTAEAARQNLYYVQASGQVSDALVLTNDQLDKSASFLKSQANEISKTAQENFNLVASTQGLNTALGLSNDQISKLADSLRAQQKAQDQARKAADDEKEAQRRATDAITERVKANVELARSMGVQINLHNTTVDQTDRIKEHLDDLQSDYESARKKAEDFAIANGVNVVTAVKATDGQLINIIGTLAQTKAGSADTALSVVKDFLESKKAVEQYKKATDESGLAITALGKTSTEASAKINEGLAAMNDQANKTFQNIVIGAQASLLAIAALQDRALVSQFGQVTGIAGTVSVDALVKAGLGNNASLLQSAQSGRLGGVFVAGQGRVLDSGGQLYEDVIGFGKDTGTPHLLHKNEFVVPPTKMQVIAKTVTEQIERIKKIIVSSVAPSVAEQDDEMQNLPVVMAAKGFDDYVYQPTHFIAGENGPEYVNIQPVNSASEKLVTSRQTAQAYLDSLVMNNNTTTNNSTSNLVSQIIERTNNNRDSKISSIAAASKSLERINEKNSIERNTISKITSDRQSDKRVIERSADTGNNIDLGGLYLTIQQDATGKVTSVDARLGGKRRKFAGQIVIDSSAR